MDSFLAILLGFTVALTMIRWAAMLCLLAVRCYEYGEEPVPAPPIPEPVDRFAAMRSK